MKKTFFQTKFSKALGALLLLAGLAWWHPGFIVRPVAIVVQVMALPFEQVFSFVAFEVRDIVRFLGSIGELKTENERLVGENRDLMMELALLRDIRGENDTLRKEFSLAPREQYELLSAEVIGEDVSDQGQSLLINRGSGSGVQVGMPVVVGKGVLVGKVEAVFLGSARVRLLSHPESLVAATTVERGAKGAVRGEHGLGILFDVVPRTDVIKRGDSLITSGLGGDFPRGLLIGTLQDPRYTTDKLFQQASVVAPTRYEDIRFLSVILASKS